MLVDSSAYSAFKRGHAGVIGAVRDADELAVNPTVLGELLAGFRQGSRFETNRDDLARFLASPRVRKVPITDRTAERYALVLTTLRREGTPIPINDVWIAASAMEHGLEVLTTDPHFQRVPQVLVDLHSV